MPTSGKYAQGYRFAVQSCRVGIPDVAYEWGCIRVLFQEQAVGEDSQVGHRRLSSLSEASGKRLFRDATQECRQRLLRALLGDFQFYNVRRLAGERVLPQTLQDTIY